LRLLAEKKLKAAWLVTHRFQPEEAQLAFTTAADRLDGVLKATFIF